MWFWMSLLLPLTGGLAAHAQEADAQLDTPLPVGAGIDADEVTGRLTHGMTIPVQVDGNRGYETFVVNVPRGTNSMRLVLRSEDADVDLYVRRGKIMESYDQADASALTVHPVEQLYLRGRALRHGDWYIDVKAPYGVSVDATLEVMFNTDEIPDFYENANSGLTVQAEPGTWQEGRINQPLANYQTFQISVPENTPAMYIQTRNAEYDIDLFLRHGAEIQNWDTDPDYEAMTARLDEHLVVEAKGDSIPAGDWYLDVVTFHRGDEETLYEVQVNFENMPVDDSIPDGPAVPVPGEEFTVLERAMWSTVKLDSDGGSGSGTMLSEDGYILTNHHVIYDDDAREVCTEIYVSLTHAFDQTPAQRFVAEPVEYNDELDLALLRIVTDLNGNALPADTSFYAVPMADSHAVRLGQTIWVAGYPAVGGGNSRSPISVTSGIMSGWDNPSSGYSWVKTDARINAGNSGGSMFDAEGRLLAIPTMELIDADDELGFARPVHEIPSSWLAHFSGEAGAGDSKDSEAEAEEADEESKADQ